MRLSRAEAMRRLCELTSKVAGAQFSWTVAADCWCGDRLRCRSELDDYRFESEVVEFIESAVNAAMRSSLLPSVSNKNGRHLTGTERTEAATSKVS
jgi:hypothetical protein